MLTYCDHTVSPIAAASVKHPSLWVVTLRPNRGCTRKQSDVYIFGSEITRRYFGEKKWNKALCIDRFTRNKLKQCMRGIYVYVKTEIVLVSLNPPCPYTTRSHIHKSPSPRPRSSRSPTLRYFGFLNVWQGLQFPSTWPLGDLQYVYPTYRMWEPSVSQTF